MAKTVPSASPVLSGILERALTVALTVRCNIAPRNANRVRTRRRPLLGRQPQFHCGFSGSAFCSVGTVCCPLAGPSGFDSLPPSQISKSRFSPPKLRLSLALLGFESLQAANALVPVAGGPPGRLDGRVFCIEVASVADAAAFGRGFVGGIYLQLGSMCREISWLVGGFSPSPREWSAS
jgi:hypothetical protein